MATIVLPKEQVYEIPGCPPLIIKRDDIVSKKAWYKLTIEGSPYLGVGDFHDFDVFTKYYLVTAGLLEYSMVLIYGEEGGGKSLVMAWLSYEISRLFSKRCVFDWTPPQPELFVDFYNFNDEEFANKIQGELNVLEKVEREAMMQGKSLNESAKKNLILYNSIFALDEGDSYADKSNRTNLSKLLGRIVRRRRHFDTCIFMVFVDPHDADTRLIGRRASHEISCAKDRNRQGWCVYTITNTRNGIRKLLHLKPSDCTHLWKSKNFVKLSHDQYIYLGGKKPKNN